ncbi:MAG: hypothetical protein WA510_16500 [Acidobacteriaceae bacterium]
MPDIAALAFQAAMKSIRDISNLDPPCHATNIVACDAHVNARPGSAVWPIALLLNPLRGTATPKLTVAGPVSP